MNTTNPASSAQQTLAPMNWSAQNLEKWNLIKLEEGNIIVLPPVGDGTRHMCLVDQQFPADPSTGIEDKEDDDDPVVKHYMQLVHDLCTLIIEGRTQEICIHREEGTEILAPQRAVNEWFDAAKRASSRDRA